MASIYRKARDAATKKAKKEPFFPQVVQTNYTNIPIDVPSDFLTPLADPSTITVSQIDFKNTVLPEYRNLYAVVLDNVLSQEECDQLIHLAERSVGAHQDDAEEEVENDGWRPAMVNAGRNREVLAVDYRNSDRIIWDEKTVVSKIWQRVLQGKGIKEDLLRLEGKKYAPVCGLIVEKGEGTYVATKQGVNERMRFLKYGPGQFFKGIIS
jgi:hypothetical protein